MAIQMIGIDHSVAAIDIRTIFSFTQKKTVEALEIIKQEKGICGCVLLSTCNRMELWVSTEEGCVIALYELLCKIRAIHNDEYQKYFTERKQEDAVQHLFRLACGLESRILGEDQILTQVKGALVTAREHYAADNVLEVLFRMAVTAGKKVRTNVTFSTGNHSVIHRALQTLRQEGLEVKGKKCMVIGNGEMGKLAATVLQQEGADVTVTVRQYRSGVVQIPQGCRRIDYGKRMGLISSCDFVVSATASPNYTLTKEGLQAVDLKDYRIQNHIPVYFQWSEVWGYASYGSENIGMGGCGPTSLSMVATGLTGNTSFTPKYVADMSVNMGYYVDDVGTDWTLMTAGASELGINSAQLTNWSEDTLKSELSAGHPIICSMGPGDFTNQGHFIVLSGLTEDGHVLVNDPNSKINSRKKWDLNTIINQMNAAWSFWV